MGVHQSHKLFLFAGWFSVLAIQLFGCLFGLHVSFLIAQGFQYACTHTGPHRLTLLSEVAMFLIHYLGIRGECVYTYQLLFFFKFDPYSVFSHQKQSADFQSISSVCIVSASFICRDLRGKFKYRKWQQQFHKKAFIQQQ